MSNALSLPSGDQRTALIPSIRHASHLSDSGLLLTFAARVLIANPCSVTITTYSKTESWVPLSSACWFSKHVQNLSKIENRCVPCSSAAFTVLAWPATSPTVRSMIQLDRVSVARLTSLCNFPCQCLDRWFVVTSECNSVVAKLINEFCCSSSSRKIRSRRPRHFVSPFAYDQLWCHLFFRFPLSKESIVH